MKFDKKKVHVRTDSAQLLHNGILSFIRHGNKKKITDIIKKINENELELALEGVSIHGHSHVLDALRLPFILQKDKSLAKNRSLTIFILLINKAKNSPKILNFLLTQPDNAGFTPLQQALISGQKENLELYFNTLFEAVKKKIITSQDYKNLLIKSNQHGFNPLQQALIAGKEENLKLYFNTLFEAVDKKKQLNLKNIRIY